MGSVSQSWNLPVRCNGSESEPLRLAHVVSALSFGLDLSTGQPLGHSIQSCIIGMRIAREMDLPAGQLEALYYALLLKDCGCSGNASHLFHTLGSDDVRAKRDVKTVDWTRTEWDSIRYAIAHVCPEKSLIQRARALLQVAAKRKHDTRVATQIRCQRGALLARLMGLPQTTSEAIYSLDEHWNGAGMPDGLRGDAIPVASRIMLLAQTLAVFFEEHGAAIAIETARRRSGAWFDPLAVLAALSLAVRGKLWADLEPERAFDVVLELDPGRRVLSPDDGTFDAISTAFAEIVDAKSPFTRNHSNGVANAALAIARTQGLPADRIMVVRHAALLHDLGKLGVPNTILEKPSRLDEAEWQIVRLHPLFTWKILQAIPGFREIADIAASHHERLDGKGYFRGLTAKELSSESRIVAVADVFDSLSAKRPYREAMPREAVFEQLRREPLDQNCVAALEQSGMDNDQRPLQVLADAVSHASARAASEPAPASLA